MACPVLDDASVDPRERNSLSDIGQLRLVTAVRVGLGQPDSIISVPDEAVVC